MTAPRTLCVDVGGSAIKAAVLSRVELDGDHLRVPTPYPLTPTDLADAIASIGEQLHGYDRASVGFPGLVRAGRIVTAPFFIRPAGWGSAVSDALRDVWIGLDLQDLLATRLGRPVLVANDADVAGAGIVDGCGLEVVITLGTGFGSGVFLDGEVCPHLELAHHPLRDGESYNEHVGDAARRAIGPDRWNERVLVALEAVERLLEPDRIWVGGGNARHLRHPLPPTAAVVTQHAGLIGGVRLWEPAG